MSTALHSHSAAGAALPAQPVKQSRAERIARLTAEWLGTECSVYDGDSGELLHEPAAPAQRDWGLVGELCREVARRGRPELLAEEGPLYLAAIPFADLRDGRCVAVAAGLSRTVEKGEESTTWAELLGLAPEAAREWAAGQEVIAPDAFLRLGALVADKESREAKDGELQLEADALAEQLAATYEEISMLHRLTQNLKISGGEDDLIQLALEWLGEVLPVEGLALQLMRRHVPDSPTLDPKTESKLFTYGRCPLDENGLVPLVERLGLTLGSGPYVANHVQDDNPDWPFPEIREIVVVPLVEGENVFGWLAALNRAEDAEFGTDEASLLSSVATILGIHGGNIELYRQQAELLAGVIRALSSAIDAKDPYTCGHSDRVARVSVRLGRELGLDNETLRVIYLGGLLHDVGKIGVSDAVLQKPGRLTQAEYEHIKSHVEIGYNILVDLKKLEPMLPIVRHHHETWDGAGYPDRLAGEDIPRLARIVAVADAFDAMGSDRPYRRGMEDEKLDAVLRGGAGRQWDPEVIDAFFRARDDIRHIASSQRDDPRYDPELSIYT